MSKPSPPSLEEKFIEIALKPFGLEDKFVREYSLSDFPEENMTPIYRIGSRGKKSRISLTDKQRLFRIDFADIENKIAVEIDGGIWLRGRGAHTSPIGKIRDNIKGNWLQTRGWVILRYSTTDEMENFIGDYSAILRLRKENGNTPHNI